MKTLTRPPENQLAEMIDKTIRREGYQDGVSGRPNGPATIGNKPMEELKGPEKWAAEDIDKRAEEFIRQFKEHLQKEKLMDMKMLGRGA